MRNARTLALLLVALGAALPGHRVLAQGGEAPVAVKPSGRWLMWSPWRSDLPARDPVGAVRGEALALAWVAPDEGGHSRVHMVESVGRLPVVGAVAAFAPPSEGEEHSPALAFSRDGMRLGVAWISTSSERDLLNFSSIEPDGDRDPGVPVVISATGEAAIESPVLAWLDASTPILAWVESTGSSSAVYAGWRLGGEWQARRASEGEHPYDLAPTLLAEPSPALWYYSFDGSDVALRATQIGLWGLAREGSGVAHPSPSNRLPLLFDRPRAVLPGAAWIEPVEGGEALLLFDPMRPAESSIFVEAGDSGSRILDPASDEGAVAWIEERDGFRRLHARPVDGGHESIPVSGSARNLRIATDGGVLLAVWVEEPKDGGSGALKAAVRRERPAP